MATALGNLLGNAGINFLTNLVNAKKEGVELPAALDKVAEIAIQGETKAIEIAKEEAQKRTMQYIAWAISVILLIIVIVLLATRKK